MTTYNRRKSGTEGAGQFTFKTKSDSQTSIADLSWADIEVSDPEVIERLEDAGIHPSDFYSDNESTRMWVHGMRGDLLYEGRLFSHAFDLSSHDVPSKLGERMVVVPADIAPIDVIDEERAIRQAAYIDGYASIVSGIYERRSEFGPDWFKNLKDCDRGFRFKGVDLERVLSSSAIDYRLAGANDAYIVEHFSDAFERGLVDTVTVVSYDCANKKSKIELSNIRPAGDNLGYLADVVGDHNRRYMPDGTTVPWNRGSTVWFRKDSVRSFTVAGEQSMVITLATVKTPTSIPITESE